MSVLSNLTIPSRPYPQHPSHPHPHSQPPPFSPNPNPRKPQKTVKAPSPYSTLGLILLFRISLGTKLLTLILTSVPGCCRNTVASVALLSFRCSRAAARPPGTPSNDALGGRSGTSGTSSSAPIPTPTPTPAFPSPSDRFDLRRGRAVSRSRCSSTRAACCETHESMVRKRASDDRAVATLSRPAAIGSAAAAVVVVVAVATPFGLRFRFAFDARACAGVCGAWLFVQLKRLTSGPPKPTSGPGRGAGVEEVRRLQRNWWKVGGGGCGSCGSGAGYGYCRSEAVRERVRVVEALWRVVWRGSTREERVMLGLRAWEAARVGRGGESRRKLRGPSSSGVWLGDGGLVVGCFVRVVSVRLGGFWEGVTGEG